MFLALREFKREKLRFTMIVAVVILIAYLVYFLSSLAYGLAQINRTAIDYWDAEGIVVSKISDSNIYASVIDSSLSAGLGLDSTGHINVIGANVYVNGADDTSSLVFIGYETESAEWNAPIIEGDGIEADHDILLSSNIRDTSDVAVGDEIVVAETGRKFNVVGFTEDSNYNTQPVAYTKLMMVSQAMMSYSTGDEAVDATALPTPNMPERISAILINEPTDVDMDALDADGLLYLPIDRFIEALPGYQAQVLTFGLMIASLSVIASVIMGIFMYILTMQKKSVFGILKIQGYQNAYIIRSILYQVLYLVIAGLAIGLTLTGLTMLLLPSSVPVAFNWNLVGLVSLFTLLTSLLGSLASAYSVLKIDPLAAL